MAAVEPKVPDPGESSRGVVFSKFTRVLPRSAWIALYALGLLIVVALGWSILGTIRVKVQGTGMLLSSGGIVEVATGVDGRVDRVAVKTDDLVRPGDLICTLDLGPTLVDLDTEQKKLAKLREDKAESDPIDLQQINTLRTSIRSQEKNVAEMERSRSKGLVTNDDVLREQEQLIQLRQKLETRQDAIDNRNKEILESEGKAKELQQKLTSGEIRSPAAGRVIEISTTSGDVVKPGKSVVRIERPGELAAVLFIPAADGKKVQATKEFEVQIVPDELKQWGYIRGNVRSVSPFPASPERLKFVFGNDQVVKDFLKQYSSSMEILVGLTKAPGTKSGVVWVPAPGYPQALKSQIKCSGKITVERKRPISYVLPIGRKR